MDGHPPASGRVDSPALAVATSEHPVAAHAVAECAGALLERSADGFEHVLCLVGSPFGGALGDMAGAVGQLLAARSVAGVQSHGVLMGARVAEDAPALAVAAFGGPGVSIAHAPGDGPPGPPIVAPAGRVVLTDPFSVRHRRASAPGHLRPAPVQGGRSVKGAAGSKGPVEDQALTDPGGAVSVAGGFIAGSSTPGPTRMFLDGEEFHDGSLYLELGSGPWRIELVHGTRRIGPAMVVTSSGDGQLVALDDLPAGEMLEAAVHRADPELLAGATEVGFTVPGDPRLCAATRSRAGLRTSAPLGADTLVFPSVRSSDAAAAGLAAALGPLAPGPALVLLDTRLPLGPARSRYAGVVAESGAGVAGLLAAGILWGDPESLELVNPAALVVGQATSECGPADVVSSGL